MGRLIGLVVLAVAASASGQRPPDIPLTAQINREVVQNTIAALEKYYVSADTAGTLAEGLRQRLQDGAYDGLTSAFDLIDALDAHMQAISGDVHLSMSYSHVGGPPLTEIGENLRPETPEERAESLDEARLCNSGIQKVERLPGNIGLLELNSFIRPEFSGEAVGHAMALLAHTDALIIDLRASRGGSADMVLFLASYFFPGDESYHVSDWFTRVEGGVQQCWTYPFLPGARYLDRDVFILTARRTFSAPEGLTALLQHHGKAAVVGEPTAGGTHPVVRVRVHPHFAAVVPVSMAVYPTGTPSWPLGRPVHPDRKPDSQGTGITPDIEVPAEQALNAAHLAALQALLTKHPDRRPDLEPVIETLKAR